MKRLGLVVSIVSLCGAWRLVSACNSDSTNSSEPTANDAAVGSDARAADGTVSEDGASTPIDGGSDSAFRPPRLRIAAGDYTVCAVSADGNMGCWGSNERGQFGIGTHSAFREAHPPPATLIPNFRVTELAVNADHACAISEGQVHCWGYNKTSQLGHTPDIELDAGDAGLCPGGEPCAKQPVAVAGTNGAKAVSVGITFSCAALAEGVSCWGLGAYGAIGPVDGGTVAGRPNPVPLGPVDELRSGHDFSCARRSSDGSIWCWGSNNYGQLGRSGDAGPDAAAGDGELHPIPLRVGTFSGTRGLGIGRHHACAILDDASVVCWGYDDVDATPTGGGQLGHDTSLDRRCISGELCNPEPLAVAGLSNVRQLALGYNHSCALREDGSVLCWGFSGRGALGRPPTGDTSQTVFTPKPVSGLTGVTRITAGGLVTCATTSNDEVWCWGSNSYGVLGPPGVYGPAPVRIEPL